VYLQVQLLVDHVIPWPIGWAQSVLSVLYCSTNLRIHLASNPFRTICWFGHVSKPTRERWLAFQIVLLCSIENIVSLFTWNLKLDLEFIFFLFSILLHDLS
jgi:hypothetical protein